MARPARLIIANLDAEADFAAFAGTPRPGLSAAARRVAAASGTLLRVFASGDDDRLALLAPIDPRRMVAVAGLPRPRLVVTRAMPPATAVLAWAQTLPVSGHRPGVAGQRREAAGRATRGVPLCQAAWQWPVAEPAAAMRGNDRFFCLALAQTLDAGAPGAYRVHSLAAWRRAVAAIGGPWVAKARFAAAGRWRARGEAHPSALAIRQVARLLARHGALVLEPWFTRAGDFGVVALARAGDPAVLAAHRLLVDAAGGFCGIQTVARFAGIEAWDTLAVCERRRLVTVVGAVGRALAACGYLGPFGIDAWRFRHPDGSLGFHALGEINARMTFGLVARAMIDRLREPLGLGGDQRVTLRLGRGAIPAQAVALLAPAPEDATCAWLEIERDGAITRPERLGAAR